MIGGSRALRVHARAHARTVSQEKAKSPGRTAVTLPAIRLVGPIHGLRRMSGERSLTVLDPVKLTLVNRYPAGVSLVPAGGMHSVCRLGANDACELVK